MAKVRELDIEAVNNIAIDVEGVSNLPLLYERQNFNLNII